MKDSDVHMETDHWIWRMDWCKRNNVNPGDSYFWDKSGKEFVIEMNRKEKKLSIDVLIHWRDNVIKADKGELSENDICDCECVYCREYYSFDVASNCDDCPVYIDTGVVGCYNTPLIDIVIMCFNTNVNVIVYTWDEFMYLCNVMMCQGLIDGDDLDRLELDEFDYGDDLSIGIRG